MNPTKAQLINTIYNSTLLNKYQSAQSIETLIEIIKLISVSGEDVMFSSFGKFHINNNNHRRIGTAQTANQLIHKAQRVVTFLCSPVLKGKINGNGYEWLTL